MTPVCVVIRSAKHLASAEWRWWTPPPLLHTVQWSWCRSMGHVQTRLAALTLGHVGEMLVARAAAGCASISRRAIETWKETSVVCFIGFAVRLLKVGACVFGRLGDEDGSLNGVVDMRVYDLFMSVALDGADQCSLYAVCAQGSAQGFQEEGWSVHLLGKRGLELELPA